MSDIQVGVRLRADGSGLVGELRVTKDELDRLRGSSDEAGRSAERTGRQVDNSSRSFQRMGSASQSLARNLRSVIAPLATIAGSVLSFRAVINATVEQERASLLLEQRLRSTGRETEFTSRELHGLASAMQEVTTFGDEAVLAAQRILLPFEAISRESFPRVLELTLDMAEEMGGLENAARNLGRAMDDPVRAIQRLERQGVSFRSEVDEQIRALAENGQLIEAQELLLSSLERAYGGTARAARDTLGGALSALRNAFGDLLEGDGDGVRATKDAIEDLTDLLNDEQVKQGFQSMVQGVLTLAGWMAKLATAATDAAQGVGEFFARMAVGNDGSMEEIAREIQRIDARLAGAGGFSLPPASRDALRERRAALQEQLAFLQALDRQNQSNTDSEGRSTDAARDNAAARRALERAQRAGAEAVRELNNEAAEQLALLRDQVALIEAGVAVEEARARVQLAARGFTAAQVEEYLRLNAVLDGFAERAKAAERADQAFADMLRRTRTAALTPSEQAVQELTQRLTDLRELFARGLIDEAEFERLEERLTTSTELTDELRRLFETLFGTGLSESLVETLSDIERVRNAFEDFDAPFNRAIDRMLDGLQTFAVAAEQSGSQAAQLWTAGTAQMLGGVQQLATQGSRAYEQLGAAITVLQGITAIQAILNQGAAGDPFTAFARMAAMATAVASMGVAVGGAFGGGGGSAPSQPGTGSVFGDPQAQSESIRNAVEITADATQALVGINTQMLDALRTLSVGLDAVGRLIVRQGVGFDAPGGPSRLQNQIGGTLAGGAALGGLGLSAGLVGIVGERLGGLVGDLAERILPGALGEIVGGLVGGLSSILGGLFSAIGGLFSSRPKIKDEGIRILSGTFAELTEEVFAEAFADIKIKRRFRSNKDKFETEALGDDIGNQFRLIFRSIGDSAIAAAEVLGVSQRAIDEALANLDIDEIRISTRGKTGEEISEQVNAAFSKVFDEVAAALVPAIDDFARLGEGAGETLVRVASNILVAEASLDRLGLSIVTGLEDSIAQAELIANTLPGIMGESMSEVAERLRAEAGLITAEISTLLVDAAGGLEELARLTGGFVTNFLPEAEQIEIATRELQSAFAGLGLEMPTTREGFRDLVQGIQEVEADNAELVVSLLQLGDAMDELFSASQRLANQELRLQIELLRLQGDEEQALRLERQRQLDQTPESLRALQESIFVQQDLNAAQEATQAELRDSQQAFAEVAQAIGQASLSIQQSILRLRQAAPNFDAVGFQTGRIDELRGQLGSGSARDQINTVQELQSAIVARYEAEQQRVQEQMRAQQQIGQATRQANDRLRQLKDTLIATADALLINESVSPLTNRERFDEAQAQFREAARAARAGDQDAMASLSGLAQSLARENAGFFGSSAAGIEVFDEIQQTLRSVGAASAVPTQRVTGSVQISGGAVGISDASLERMRRQAIEELEELQTILDQLLEEQAAEAEAQQAELLAGFERFSEELVAQGLTQDQALQAQRDILTSHREFVAEQRRTNELLMRQIEQTRRDNELLRQQNDQLAQRNESLARENQRLIDVRAVA